MNQNAYVNVYRGQQIESRHQIHAAVVRSNGEIIQSFGNPQLKTFTRSTIKPIQALPLFISNAIKKFNYEDHEIALACASHVGAEIHTHAVTELMKKIDLTIPQLHCGDQIPSDVSAYKNLILQNQSESAIHNNCSGKHVGFLATCVANQWPTANYTEIEHPLQKQIQFLFEQLSNEKITADQIARDGCHIPTFCVTIIQAARAVAAMSDFDQSMINPYGEFSKKIFSAVSRFPEYIGGEQEYSSLMTKYLGHLSMIKVGAEGVMAAYLPQQKLGIFLKVEDGSERATEVAMTAILQKLKLIDHNCPYPAFKTKNRNGAIVGHYEFKIVK